MKRTTCLYLTLLLCLPGMIQAQEIKGFVFDHELQPVEAVAVVMQTMDSIYVSAVMTDSTGLFVIPRPLDQTYRLLFQHILFEPKAMEIRSGDVGTIQLTPRNYALGEIVVKGERPVVRVEGGTLSYDVPQLIANKTSTNAFEAVREIPGVIGGDASLELVGARSLRLVINGQLTTMSMEQLIQLLKTMPASRVEKVEVMYNAPARYNVKGSLINVVLSGSESEEPVFQGEVGASYKQKHYASGSVYANLLYTTPKLAVDLMVKPTAGRSYTGEDMEARHTVDNRLIHIEQYGRSRGEGYDSSARLGMDYTFSNQDKLSGAYYVAWDDRETTRTSTTRYRPMDDMIDGDFRDEQSESRSDMRSVLHNIRLQYDGHKGLMAGADYTYYHAPSTLQFDNGALPYSSLWNDATKETHMFNDSRQDVSRASLFLNHTLTLGGWRLNYGAQGGYSLSDNRVDYAYDTGNGYVEAPDERVDNTQKDYNANGFVEVTTRFGSRFSATVALKADYFRSDYQSLTEELTLWEDWTLLPTASLSYTFSPYHILQFNVTSDKTYPSYWTLSPQRHPLNSYSEMVGNPQLKPYRSYDMQLMYIHRQKYVLMAFATYEPDFFTQVPYQSNETVKNVFRYENFDYSLKTGLVAIIPFKVGRVWDSRWTVQGFRMQQKSDHFHDMSFNKEDYVGAIVTQNTFNLSSRPNLKLTFDGLYVTGGIQGIYDLGAIRRLDAGLKYIFAGEKASLTLTAYDIFETGIPKTIEINHGNQWSRINDMNNLRYVQLAFSYKFGGYKAKQHKAVDTSRLGK
ncbi:outer membrane beta-barrel family protein [Parabacteroides sp. PF5-6]|uniref:outer membrane beta-barrel family protein n=1 Tax=Parabacteroides sp. PF5-6 TaxID=1742403 RepID=UPI0024065F33|nr:outer membrane beta-barrel family protein [Parabacteroides sp. PF5-6]MDF9830755.1 hypothetical protein [Parabacteroides sp. PF5-6]